MGETKKSSYKRGNRHKDDSRFLREKSRLLKHFLTSHLDLKLYEEGFGIGRRDTFKSALEIQIGKAVSIELENAKGKTLMNSKSVFNRCSLPRITSDLRNHSEQLSKLREEEEREKEIREKIKKLRRENIERRANLMRVYEDMMKED